MALRKSVAYYVFLRSEWKDGSSKWCPLDGVGGEKWHDRHDESSAGLADWDKVESENPTVDACVVWVEDVLNRPELNDAVFNEFFGEVESQVPSEQVPSKLREHPQQFREHVRLCWTAHLVADYACAYWHKATGQPTWLHYTCMKPDDRKAMGAFVKSVGRIILDKRFADSGVLSFR